VACARLGLDFLGIEIDRGYLDESVSRTRDEAARPASLVASTD
jgi:DNA modification methylase